ncbi:MAG: valine--tRNA ligase [Patescibacteria group bacterium]|jgi:valyl-tRNA synthetase
MSESAYNPSRIEKEIYALWEKSGYFNPDNLPGKRTVPFVISMPPPNVTGQLHLGHAIGIAIQDTLTRFERMRGKKTLWVPGTDHAGIATQIVVERLIAKEGLDRHKLGREKFLKLVWDWKEKYGTSITTQIRAMGASCDWSREAFTMDKNLSLAVRTAFKILYDRKLIYRGKRIISWCPRCSSAISDLEVNHVETQGKLYTIRYPLIGSTKYITVATTRPETMLGDTAIAVHPNDPRYKKLIGKKVTVPIVEREISIIADKAVEQGFGTGAVKITPAHDPLDFEIGARHKLESIQVVDENAKMTKEAGAFYGMHVQDARRAVVEELEKSGHIEQIVDYINNVAHCQRCGTVIEPLISTQWFMSMKSIAKPALQAVKQKKIVIVPGRFTKTYYHWLNNIHDWTLSRQLWWGHQIPVWYCDACGTDHPIVAIDAPKTCPRCKSKKLHRDPDTLDTWFSSGLWTFSTLGWPLKTRDLKFFHPTTVMETAWDILFFWVARMIMMSLALTKEIPFTTVYFHGLVLDREGKKMSKSKGNGIDPIPMAQKYGTDAIRLSLILGTTPGQDFRMVEEKIAHQRNFINKVWNIGRFIQSQKTKSAAVKPKTVADMWILSRLARVRDDVTKNLESFAIADAGDAVYNFLWHEFADWYIEIVKIEGNPGFAKYIFLESLKLLHPFAPFVTEQLWKDLTCAKTKQQMLMIQAWPKKLHPHPKAEKEFAALKNIITSIRTIRNITQTPHATELHVRITGKQTSSITKNQDIFKRLTKTGKIEVVQPKTMQPTLTFPGLAIDLQLGDDAQKLLHKETERLSQTIQRLDQLLTNASFTRKAPVSIVQENKLKLREAQDMLKRLSYK